MRAIERGITILALLGVILPNAVHADSAKVPLKGLAKSGAAIDLSTPTGSPQVVIAAASNPITTTGSGYVLVVTDVCMSFSAVAPSVTRFFAGATPLNVMEIDNSVRGSKCHHFEPGMIVPEGSDLTCTVSGSSSASSCSASGIVTKKQ